MKLRAVSGIMLAPFLITMLTSVFGIQSVKTDPTVISGWLTFPVTFDGKMTTVEEWSDTTPVDITLLLGHVGPGTVSAKVWIKNDDAWLYMLYRVEWPAGDTDPLDDGGIAYFWDSHMDFGSVLFGNVTSDLYGYWENDTDASPPGENNVEGAATHDGTYYWFEFRKELNSGDGYDWSFTPGQIIETGLLVGVWDKSIGDAYYEYISLHLSAPPPIITATIDIHPQELNLKSKGKWITCYIELPEGYNVSDIDRATILLNGTVPVDPFWVDKPLESVIGDYDDDGIIDLMVKFSRTEVIEYIRCVKGITHGNGTLTITGELFDGTFFESSDMIGVRMPGDENCDRCVDIYDLVIPEFPLFTMPLIFMVFSLIAVVFKLKKKKQ